MPHERFWKKFVMHPPKRKRMFGRCVPVFAGFFVLQAVFHADNVVPAMESLIKSRRFIGASSG